MLRGRKKGQKKTDCLFSSLSKPKQLNELEKNSSIMKNTYANIQSI